MKHHFTVDVEEYFHPTSVAPWFPRSGWGDLERRSQAVIPGLLDLLEEYEVRATFFVLGWLAEREPGLVRRIADRGHEIASHGWAHRPVPELGPEAFRTSVRRTRRLLQDLCGRRVTGYRAPSFSIVPGCEWALEVLLDEGYEYDSSIVPTSLHPSYGYPDGHRDPHWWNLASGQLVEVPPTTARLVGADLPAGGGAYFRLLPYALARAGLRQAEDRGSPGTFYIHPWELDPAGPELSAPWPVRLRVRGGTGRVVPRLERLLSEFSFDRVDRTVADVRRNVCDWGQRRAEATWTTVR